MDIQVLKKVRTIVMKVFLYISLHKVNFSSVLYTKKAGYFTLKYEQYVFLLYNVFDKYRNYVSMHYFIIYVLFIE